MKRRFRLRNSADFKRVRQLGKSFAHPLIVLIVLTNGLDFSKIGISAGRNVGNAVQRNRAKRRLREAVRPFLPHLSTGKDIVLLARRQVNEASFREVQSAVGNLLRQAHLWVSDDNDSRAYHS